MIRNSRINHRDVFRTDFIDQFLKLVEVHVAFEGVLLILAIFWNLPQKFLVEAVAEK
jgi:hypothetical protein